MQKKIEISVFWFRRDLRLDDNVGLRKALNSGLPVLPIFIFDEEIIDSLSNTDARISFIYTTLKSIDLTLKNQGSSLLIQKGNTLDIWKELLAKYTIKEVYFNKDYEPYAIDRDRAICKVLKSHSVATNSFKDQVIFEENEILKADQSPYTVFTPYKNKWLSVLASSPPIITADSTELFTNFYTFETLFPTLESIGFIKSKQKVIPHNLNAISDYHLNRDFPALNSTSYLSPHLRFGTVSIRKLVRYAQEKNAVFLSELIWREFFMHILYQFPKVVTNNFRSKYDGIPWRNDPAELKQWQEGKTGYPLVDAGMRELNATGYMHNRVRMVTAGFLCKHLLIDWRIGEAYFAEKLLDYELSSNNGNWQWAAGTGCDAAPYFRIFNPELQLKKFDKELKYVRKWIPEFDSTYPDPIVEHKSARERCLNAYKIALANY